MQYMHVDSDYDGNDQPIEIFSEIDAGRKEIRKIHLFPDGRFEAASLHADTVSTGLSTEPLPEIDFINEQLMFRARYISRQKFEEVWASIDGC